MSSSPVVPFRKLLALFCASLLSASGALGQSQPVLAPTSFEAVIPQVPGYHITNVLDLTESGKILVQATLINSGCSRPLILSRNTAATGGLWEVTQLDFTGQHTRSHFNYYAKFINEAGWVAGTYRWDVGTGENRAFVTSSHSGSFRYIVADPQYSVEMLSLDNSTQGNLVAAVNVPIGKRHVRNTVASLQAVGPLYNKYDTLQDFSLRTASGGSMTGKLQFLPSSGALVPHTSNLRWQIQNTTGAYSRSGYSRLRNLDNSAQFRMLRPGESPTATTSLQVFTLLPGEMPLFVSEGGALAGAGTVPFFYKDNGTAWTKVSLPYVGEGGSTFPNGYYIPEAISPGPNEWVLASRGGGARAIWDAGVWRDIEISFPGGSIQAIHRLNSNRMALATGVLRGYVSKVILLPLADTDRDGLSDAFEGNQDLAPYWNDDAGNDGVDSLTNSQEFQAGTNPFNPDTDGDGISDSKELQSGLDPRDPVDGAADWDNDHLTNAQEIAANLNFAGDFVVEAGQLLPEQYEGPVTHPDDQSWLPEPFHVWELKAATADDSLLVWGHSDHFWGISLLYDQDQWNDLTDWQPNGEGFYIAFGMGSNGVLAGWVEAWRGWPNNAWLGASRFLSTPWEVLPTDGNYFQPSGGTHLFGTSWQWPLILGRSQAGAGLFASTSLFDAFPSWTTGVVYAGSSAEGGHVAINGFNGLGTPVALVGNMYGTGPNAWREIPTDLKWFYEDFYQSLAINAHGAVAYPYGNYQSGYHVYELPAGASDQATRRDIHATNLQPYVTNPRITGYSKAGKLLLSAGSWPQTQYLVQNRTAIPVEALLGNLGVDIWNYPLASGACFDEEGNIHALVFDPDFSTDPYNPRPRHVKVIPQNDSDGDGIADDWEVYFFGQIGQIGQLVGSDFDGDGLSDLDEFIRGTDPKDTDSDNDGDLDGTDPGGTDASKHRPMLIIHYSNINLAGDSPSQMYRNDWPTTSWDFTQWMDGSKGDGYGSLIVPTDEVESLYELEPLVLESTAVSKFGFSAQPRGTFPSGSAHVIRIPLDDLIKRPLPVRLAESAWRFDQFFGEGYTNGTRFKASRMWLRRGAGQNTGNVDMPEITQKHLLRIHKHHNFADYLLEPTWPHYPYVLPGVPANYSQIETITFAIPSGSEIGTITTTLGTPSATASAESSLTVRGTFDDPWFGLFDFDDPLFMNDYTAHLGDVEIELHSRTIKSVSFSGPSGTFYRLTSDNAETDYVAPHWNDADDDGRAVTSQTTGDKNYPVAYLRNTKPKIEAVISLPGIGTGASVKIRATSSVAGFNIPETTGTITANGIVKLPPTQTSDALPDSIQCHSIEDNTAVILTWQVNIANGGWTPAGSSNHTVYVILATPLTDKRQETLFYIGTNKAVGTTTPEAAFPKIYEEFEDRDVRRVGSTDPMIYWKGGINGADNADDLLASTDGNGSCEAWSDLLFHCIKSQGINAAINSVTHKDTVVRTPPNPIPSTFIDLLIKNREFPISYAAGTYVLDASLTGTSIPAQGNPTPPYIFNTHYIVSTLSLFSGVPHYSYMDPSYGTPILSRPQPDADALRLSYQNSAISGFGDLSSPTKFKKTTSGLLEIIIAPGN